MYHKLTCIIIFIFSSLCTARFIASGPINYHKLIPKNRKSLLENLHLTYQSLASRDTRARPVKKYCELTKSSLVSAANSGDTSHGTSSASPHPSSGAPNSTLVSAGVTRTSSGTSSATPTPTPSSIWKLAESHQGSNFFDGWNFFQGSDPTGGVVTYLDKDSAQSNKLIQINAAGHAIMSVETTPTVPSTRMSVRIESKSVWNANPGTLIIMDAHHIPTGCSTWPAFWTTNGGIWPSGGEIDIVESVHDYTNNQVTLHTDPGCSLDPSSSAYSGSSVGSLNCWSDGTNNAACGIRAAEASVGVPFNQNNGGVYTMQWDENGISAHFFPRGKIPSDIDSGFPQPTTWGVPMARWTASTCNPSKLFFDHNIIFDTTLCGQWASAVWGVNGIPGQEQSCAQRTGFSTCEDYARAKGSSFSEAYWEVDSVKIYQKSA